MSIKLMSQVWERDFPGDVKLVLLAMADHADDDGDNIFPSVARIAAKCNVSERTVQRHLAKLREQGVLEVQRPGSGRGNPTKYRINLKGVRLSPFFGERVTSAPEKGDTGDVKGDTALSPESSEPSSTESSAPSSRSEKSPLEQMAGRVAASLDPEGGSNAAGGPTEPSAHGSTVEGPDGPLPRSQWSMVEESCIENLWNLDARWRAVSWSALKKLVNEFGHVVVSFALQRCWESRTIPERPYPYLRGVCQTVLADITAEETT